VTTSYIAPLSYWILIGLDLRDSDASDVMQVAHHYFENGIAYFTRRINRCISLACANGEVAPFVGHNAYVYASGPYLSLYVI